MDNFIMKTRLFKYKENFTSKNWKFLIKNFQLKNSDSFHISAQNIDCGYSLEQFMFSSRNKKNNVYPVNPSFTV